MDHQEKMVKMVKMDVQVRLDLLVPQVQEECQVIGKIVNFNTEIKFYFHLKECQDLLVQKVIVDLQDNPVPKENKEFKEKRVHKDYLGKLVIFKKLILLLFSKIYLLNFRSTRINWTSRT